MLRRASTSRPSGNFIGSALLVAALTAAMATPVAAATPAMAVGPSVIAGAEIPAGTFDFANRLRACTHHVAMDGDDDNDGTSLALAWRSPGEAMDQLRVGQTACVHEGTYDASALDPAHSGTATAPIALVRAPAEARPVIRSTTDASPLVSFSEDDSYWMIRGLVLDKNKHGEATVQILGSGASPAHHVAIRNNRIRDGKSGAAVLIRNAATDILVHNNKIFGHHRWVNGAGDVSYTQKDDSYLREDANGINLEGTAGGPVARVRVRDNRIHDNGGDGLQCLGVDDLTGPHENDPADLDMVDNRIYSNTENAVDIKSCQRVSIRGSDSPALPGDAADNKLYGYRPTEPGSELGGNISDGTAIVVHFYARGVLIANTRIWDACRGVVVGRGDDGVEDVIVRRTLMFDMAAAADCEDTDSVGLDVVLAQRMDIYHNSFAGITGAAVQVGPSSVDPTVSTDVDIFNNIVDTSELGHWINAYTPRLVDFESDYNLFWHPDAGDEHFVLDNNLASLQTWQDELGQDTHSVHGDPRWVDDPADNDYFTRPTSPARDAALLYGQPFCGTDPDVGFRESGC